MAKTRNATSRARASEPVAAEYTSELHRRIVRALRSGLSETHAAAAAGVSRRSFDDWQAWGAEGREPYATLALDVQRAIALHALELQRIVTDAATGDRIGNWAAAARLLERRFPTLYAARDVEHSDGEVLPEPSAFKNSDLLGSSSRLAKTEKSKTTRARFGTKRQPAAARSEAKRGKRHA